MPSKQETMNFWKQTTHVMSYFKGENFRGDRRLPSNFMTGFLEVSRLVPMLCKGSSLTRFTGSELKTIAATACVYISFKTLCNELPRNAAMFPEVYFPWSTRMCYEK